jgi:stearoyl-CoA desaturase (delta-9 desaturase)
MNNQKTSRHINWTNTLFLILTPIIAVIGTYYIVATGSLHIATLALAFALFWVGGMCITAGYHRLFAHQTYKAVWPVRLFFAIMGTAVFEGSVLEWSTDHRNHHRYTDTDKDPYDIKKGFWYAHIGWLFTLDTNKRDFSNVEDLLKDPILRFQHKFFVPLAILTGFGIPTAIAALWGDALGGLIIAGFVRVVLVHHATFAINSVCHIFGKQTYREQSARDNWLTAYFTFGEGYHNFHHQFAMDYRNGIRAWDFDPGKWLIWLMARVGLAKDLKTVSKEKIIRYHVKADESKVLSYAKTRSEPFVKQILDLLEPLRDRTLEIAAKLEELEKNYKTLKQQKVAYLKGKMSDYQQILEKERANLQKTREDLKHALINWQHFVNHRVKRMPVSL